MEKDCVNISVMNWSFLSNKCVNYSKTKSLSNIENGKCFTKSKGTFHALNSSKLLSTK